MRQFSTFDFRGLHYPCHAFPPVPPPDAGPGLGPGRGIVTDMRSQADLEMPGQGDDGRDHHQGALGRGGHAQGRLRHLRQLLQLHQGAGHRADHGQYRFHGLRRGAGRHSQVLQRPQTRAGRSGMHQRRSAIAARAGPADLPGQRPGQGRQGHEGGPSDLQLRRDQPRQPHGSPECRHGRFHQGVHRDERDGEDELHLRPAPRLRPPGHIAETQVRKVHHLRLRRTAQPADGR